MQIHWIQFNLSLSETLVPTRINESLYPAITIFQLLNLKWRKNSIYLESSETQIQSTTLVVRTEIKWMSWVELGWAGLKGNQTWAKSLIRKQLHSSLIHVTVSAISYVNFTKLLSFYSFNFMSFNFNRMLNQVRENHYFHITIHIFSQHLSKAES